MPEPGDHSRIEGKYNEWVLAKSDDGEFYALLRDGQDKTALLCSAPYKDKSDARDVITRATSGNVMQRFTDLT